MGTCHVRPDACLKHVNGVHDSGGKEAGSRQHLNCATAIGMGCLALSPPTLQPFQESRTHMMQRECGMEVGVGGSAARIPDGVLF